MKVSKALIVDILQRRGDHETAVLAGKGLPATIDLIRDQDLLHRFGLEQSDVQRHEAQPASDE